MTRIAECLGQRGPVSQIPRRLHAWRAHPNMLVLQSLAQRRQHGARFLGLHQPGTSATRHRSHGYCSSAIPVMEARRQRRTSISNNCRAPTPKWNRPLERGEDRCGCRCPPRPRSTRPRPGRNHGCPVQPDRQGGKSAVYLGNTGVMPAGWQVRKECVRRDLNPQPSVPKTDALSN